MTRWTRYVDARAFTTLAPLACLLNPTKESPLFDLGESLDRIVEQAYGSICYGKINAYNQTRVNSSMQRPQALDRPLMVKLQKASYRQWKGLWERLIYFVCRKVALNQGIELAYPLTPK
jgi:hypothetical protein